MRWDYNITDNECYLTHSPKIMYINRYGYIFPNCKTYKTKHICHIRDNDAVNIVKGYYGDDTPFHMITVEFNSVCNARCFYCFQRDGIDNSTYEYYTELLLFLSEFSTHWIFFSGGEILVQPKSIEFMYNYRLKCPDSWIHLKTNGNADNDKIQFISDCCNSVMVSFNGFSPSIYRTIMGIDVEKTIKFCESIIHKTSTKLGLKFLNSPISIVDIPNFLNWSLSLDPQCIVIQTAYNYSFSPEGASSRLDSTFDKMKPEYWNPIIERVSNNVEKILIDNYNKINSSGNYLTADKEFIDILSLSEKTIQEFRTDGVYRIE